MSGPAQRTLPLRAPDGEELAVIGRGSVRRSFLLTVLMHLPGDWRDWLGRAAPYTTIDGIVFVLGPDETLTISGERVEPACAACAPRYRAFKASRLSSTCLRFKHGDDLAALLDQVLA